MIVVDSSALLAVVLDEAQSDACAAALEADVNLLISAATMAEALIVGFRRGRGQHVANLIAALNFEIVSVTPASAHLVAAAYSTWGKGVHKASLNFGDCFSYVLAKERDCGLLFVGNDFSQTDVKRVL